MSLPPGVTQPQHAERPPGLDRGQEDVPPNQTIYLQNLNEKIAKAELKKNLYALFSQFGPILEVIALKTLKMRGQAFIVFKDIGPATNAVRALQGFTIYGKPLRVNFAKTKSDAAARLDGTWKPKEKKKTPKAKPKVEEVPKRQKVEEAPPPAKTPDAPEPKKPAGPKRLPAREENPPSPILFVQNLPDETTTMMLSMLFQQFPGFKEVRLVPGKKGIAFVEFENEIQSGVAMNGLQGFKITTEHLMVISFAKR